MKLWALAVVAFAASFAEAQARPILPSSPLTEFNKALQRATLAMNDSATLALWDESGISMLPNAAPVVGKAAITKYFTSIASQLKGAKMQRFDLRCFDGWGKMAFVLRRAADGRWRLTQEVWLPATSADSVLMRH